jgi:hypothetical protein
MKTTTDKTTDPDATPVVKDDRAEKIERKSWILTGLLVLLSLPFRSVPVVTGIVIGALLVILNFRWLRDFARALLAGDRQPSKFLVFLYLLKYLFTGLVIFAVIRYDLSDAIGIMVGVSVIFLAICWEGVDSHRKLGGGTNHATDF